MNPGQLSLDASPHCVRVQDHQNYVDAEKAVERHDAFRVNGDSAHKRGSESEELTPRIRSGIWSIERDFNMLLLKAELEG